MVGYLHSTCVRKESMNPSYRDGNSIRFSYSYTGFPVTSGCVGTFPILSCNGSTTPSYARTSSWGKPFVESETGSRILGGRGTQMEGGDCRTGGTLHRSLTKEVGHRTSRSTFGSSSFPSFFFSTCLSNTSSNHDTSTG